MAVRITKHLQRLAREERAVALPEFALVAPLLFLVLFGMISFGKAFNYWIDQTHLANEAARLAAVNNNPGAGAGLSLQDWIQQQADTSELKNGGSASVPDAAKVCIRFPNGTSNAGDPVEVVVWSNYNWMPILKLSPTQVRIQGASTMRLETRPTNYTANPADCPS
jgi:Flp pilus assembly protein TadG